MMPFRRTLAGLLAPFLFILLVASGCGGGGGGTGPGQSNQKPINSTYAATLTTTSTTILNGDANPNGQATTAHFEWGLDSGLVGASTTPDNAIGSGSASVALSVPLAGLTASTTYYYRVVATNAAGTTYGSIASFTTATPNAPPTVQTLGATGIATGGGALNGDANPNGLATTAYFEWGLDSALVGASTTPDQAIGGGSTSVALSVPLAGLAASTKYYYRVVATNAAGTTYGSIASFTTATPYAPPTVHTLGATGIATGAATLNGDANPNGQATTARFDWGLDSSLVGASTTPDQAMGNGSAGVALSGPLAGLAASTTYYYRVVATNVGGTTYGSIASFTTAAPNVPPTVQTLGATGITTGGGTLNGNANPNGQAATAHFEWGLDSGLAGAASTPDQAIGGGLAGVPLSVPRTGLIASTTYYYRVVATNAAGTTYGSIENFTTATPNVPPTVQTLGATGITTGGGTLNGNANPNGHATTAHFDWGTDSALSSPTSTASQSVGSGNTGQALSASLTGLAAGTTYYYRVSANNSAGTSNGTILSFTPSSTPPPAFLDDFSTDTTVRNADIGTTDPYTIDYYDTIGGYTVRVYADVTNWVPGSGEGMNYNSAYQSAGAKMSVNHGVVISHALPSSSQGVFSMDFVPVRIYGDGAGIVFRLMHDANNYYEISNGVNDIWRAAPAIKKVVGGVEVFNRTYTETYDPSAGGSANYPIRVTFSPSQVTWEAFGYTYTYDDPTPGGRSISVTSAVLDFWQQDAAFDNIKLISP